MKIGNATLSRLSKKRKLDHEYSDGPVEDEMLSLVKSEDFKTKRARLLANKPSWAMYYHFTPSRGNIINWKKIPAKSKVLEVGAGCGAITEALLELVDESVDVDALELSEKRATINAYRNKRYKNLRVLIGNLEEIDFRKYDYIICIGVLEYAGRFISGDNPFSVFIKKLHSLLTPGGELLLAIENKMGIKYINGAREDHVGRYYESIMNYPQYDGIRTFSKKELSDLFLSAGFNNIEFFFPIPDYKMPSVILSEKMLSTSLDLSFISRFAPAPAYDQPRIHSASEQLITENLIEAGLYGEFSNSFLIKGVRS